MISKKDDFFLDLKNNISREIKIAREIGVFFRELEKKENSENKKEIESQIKNLKVGILEINENIAGILEKMTPSNPINPAPQPVSKSEPINGITKRFSILQNFSSRKPRNKIKLTEGEKETLKRIREKEENKKS